jgi:hypothetical protein
MKVEGRLKRRTSPTSLLDEHDRVGGEEEVEDL